MKPGYKQTEVGMIPDEWEVKSLDCIGRVIRGSSPRPKGDKRFYGGSVPRLMVEDVTRDRKFVTPSIDFLTIEGAKRSRPCKQGTLTVVCSGTPSAVGLPSILAVDACIHDGMLALVQLGRSVDPEYLFYRLTSLQEQLHASATHGGTFVNLTTTGFGAFTITLPPLPEQRTIAKALSDMDALLGVLDQLIAKKRDLKQAAMQQLLTGQQRLPGFQGEWEAVQFSDIADRSIPWSIGGGPFGSNLKASDYTHEGVRIIQLQNIGDGRFHDDYAIYTSDVKADELLSNNIFPGEIILSKMGDPVARACFVPTVDRRYLMASDGIRLAVDSRRYNRRFVHDYINSPYFRKKAIEASTGSTRQRIGLVELKRLAFIAPPLPEQTAIAEVLSDMDAEIAALEKRRDKTRALKQGMMQKLLTGKTRLV